jgi:hypothetical protein
MDRDGRHDRREQVLGRPRQPGRGSHRASVRPNRFLSLRWYNPTARQWFLTFANAANGTLGVPLAGVFNNGWLDLYDAEPMDGKQILVHFAIWPTSKDAGASEQAFSADGGRTWEVNYKTRYTRIAVK